MKIGILTFHDGINYGAFFQAFSLQSFLKKEGHECKIINYKSLGFTAKEYRCFLDPFRQPPANIARNLIKISKFKSAHKRLDLTKRIFNPVDLAKLKFDAVIIGSDEVWNCGSSLVGYDPVYFSKGISSERIISYAASFGSVNSCEEVPGALKESLKRLKYVSVRDENSQKIMRDITKKPVSVALDPVFLCAIKEEAMKPTAKDFILVYGYFFSDEMADQITRYARLSGKKLISVGYHLSWCDISMDALNPFEWLGYFDSCNYVITSMYHGMLFSLLNNKEFCMIATPYRRNKLGNFLSRLGLSERVIEEKDNLEKAFRNKIDYAKVNSMIEEQCILSKSFLSEALER